MFLRIPLVVALVQGLMSVVMGQAAIKTLKEVSVKDFKIRITDEVSAADWSTGFQSVAYPNKGATLQGTEEHRLQIAFSIAETASKAAVQPHQVFIRLESQSGKEVIFYPESEAQAGNYKLDVDLKTKAVVFDYQSGKYEVSLIVGDAKIRSFEWKLSDVSVKFSREAIPFVDYYARKPDIVHMFRQPEKRPPVFVSNVFGFVILGLFFVMLILWSRIGLSLSNMSASSLLFQISFGAILGIEYLFFLGNDMFTTLRYLSWASPFALYFGRRMLAHSAKVEEEK